MKILIPILGFARAGGYRVLSEFASCWKRAGHTIHFLVPDTSGPPYFPTEAEILLSDRSGRVSTGTPVTFRKVAFQGVDNLVKLYRGLNSIGNNYDIILANQSLTTWPVRFAHAGHAKKFYYIQAYEPEYYVLERRPVKWILSKLSYHLGLIPIVNAPLYCKYKGIKTFRVIPPGVDLNTFHPKPHHKNFQTADEIILGCIGRQEPAKGTQYVLDAFVKLWEVDKRIRLRVAYGNLPRSWSHPATEIVVPKNDSELADYYRSVDIMIAPGTVQHGAPHYPVMEAMACGTPVVTTGYMPADADNSWLVPSSDAGAIHRAILAIVADDRYTHRVYRALEAMQIFAWDKAAGDMIHYFIDSLKP